MNMNKPKNAVYNTHVKTFSIMRKMTGAKSVTRIGDGSPNYIFRILPKFRGPESLALRKSVADEVRRLRA